MNDALQTMITNMPEKTGKSLEEWKVILKEKAFKKHTEGLNFLKKEYGVSHGFANTIVSLSKNDDSSDEDLVNNQYKGKENLRPIYDKLIRIITNFGDDVKKIPKKTSVSLVRKHQFLLIKPATKSRIDLGFKLKDHPQIGRLGGSGSFGTMCTHCVKLTSVDDIDKELRDWMKLAYERSV